MDGFTTLGNRSRSLAYSCADPCPVDPHVGVEEDGGEGDGVEDDVVEDDGVEDDVVEDDVVEGDAVEDVGGEE